MKDLWAVIAVAFMYALGWIDGYATAKIGDPFWKSYWFGRSAGLLFRPRKQK